MNRLKKLKILLRFRRSVYVHRLHYIFNLMCTNSWHEFLINKMNEYRRISPKIVRNAHFSIRCAYAYNSH